MTDNRSKDIKIDESVLDETPPNINEPQKEVEEPKEEPKEPLEKVEKEFEEENKEETPEVEKPTLDTQLQEPQETQEQKDQRYKQQQSEAQIQAAKNKSFISKVDEANQIKEPTIDELKVFVGQDGVNWEELTPFEQATAKRTYLAEKRLQVINQAVQSTKQIDEWASKVDEFIDSTDGKPQYLKLSGHEGDFRKYSMQEAHRGTPIEVLLSAFLFNLPPVEKKRSSLFQTGGGGEKETNTGKITDVDQIRQLRENNPKEYSRLIKSGKIQIEV